ncbi:Zinc finger CCCH domain-containing protein 45 [Linum perenne]
MVRKLKVCFDKFLLLVESSSCKGNGDGYTRNENASRHMEGNQFIRKNDRLYNTRYFIIKSLNHHNLQLSVDEGIWATQVMNEPILEEAFNSSGKVILIFSVNMSGFFQGYAQMISSIGLRHDRIWSQGSGKSGSWGRSFKVKWLQLNDLPFQRTLHLKNPLNEYKPVKISRDCQELPEDIGEALCRLIDGETDVDSSLKIFPSDDFHLKSTFTEHPYMPGDGEYNGPQIHIPWGRTPMPYPSFLYNHPPDASSFRLGNPGSTSTAMPENRHLDCSPSKASRKANFHPNGHLIHPLVPHGGPSQLDFWGLTAESPRASTLTNDDFLDMTYEQYLEVHNRSINLNSSAAGRSQATGETSKSKRGKNDPNSSDRSHKRNVHEGSRSKSRSSRDEGHTSSMNHKTSRSERLDNESNSSDRSHRRTTHERSRRKRIESLDEL